MVIGADEAQIRFHAGVAVGASWCAFSKKHGFSSSQSKSSERK